MMAKVHPHEPHHYLAFLAVRPGRQGHGLGTALLRDRLRRLDAAGAPAYLEASEPRSRALYVREGFREHQEPSGFRTVRRCSPSGATHANADLRRSWIMS